MLRLAIPIQQLLNFWNTVEVQGDEHSSQPTPERDATPGDNQSEETDDSDNDTLDDVNNDASISGEAINIAASIVGTCLAQLYDLFAATVYYPTSSNYFCHLHLFMATVCLLRIGQAFFTTTFPSNNNRPNS